MGGMKKGKGDKAMYGNNFSSLAKITTIIVCIMASKGYSTDSNLPLELNLERIISQDKGRGTDAQKLEDKCLDLLKDHNSPEDKGKIYAKIASMYADTGYSSPNDIRIAKTAEYCRKALKQPLDTITACETYTRLSSSQIAPYYERPAEEFAKARKEAIVTCLTGLKLVLDNNAPKEWKEPPGVSKYEVNPNSPGYENVVKEHERQIVTRKKTGFDLKLFILRQQLIGICVTLYSSKPPYDADELEKFARNILNGHNDAVDEIMSKMRKRNSQQGHK
jgi:hypothetical protein